jgi:hypothetical protein
MAVKFPIEYNLKPKLVDVGSRWLTLTLKNVSSMKLTDMDVRLNSLDSYNLYIFGPGSFVAELKPNEITSLHYNVSAIRSTSVYITADGQKDGLSFSWESPLIYIDVDIEAARLVSLFAMTEPYPPVGETIRCEATIRGISENKGLTLEFWANSPSGDFEKVGTVETKRLAPNEVATYSAEFEPAEEGLHSIYAYLFDDGKRIGREIEVVHVREA